MITLEPTSDRKYILSVLAEPEMFAAIHGGKAPEQTAEKFLDNRIRHYRVQVDGADAGLFSLVDLGDSLDIHASLQKNCRGRKAVEAGRLMLEEAKRFNRPLTTHVYNVYKNAAWYARQFGFEPTGSIGATITSFALKD